MRKGDTKAYGELWKRHTGPAYSVARTFVSLDADDIVSEAFARVLRAIQAGGGPTAGFRPYLIMTVRNVGRRWYVQHNTINVADLEAEVDPDARHGEDSVVADLENEATVAAFRSLPSRWQEALWYSEVDGMKPREISVLLGLAPNAVSALIVRAKRGLRDAWISAQLSGARTAECEAAIKDMGAYTRGALSTRANATLERHLATCPSCPKSLAEARNLANIAVAILPVVAGTAGAAGYLSTLDAPPMSAAMASGDGLGMSETAAPSRAEDRRRRRWWLLLIAILVLAAALAATVWLINPPPSDPGGSESGADGAVSAPTDGPTPTAPAEPSETPTPTPVATAQPSPDAGTPPGGPGSPQPSGPPGDSQNPPVDAPAVPPPAPTASVSQLNGSMYPRIGGDDAAPGARVDVLAGGSVLASTTARSDGSWSVHLTDAAPGSHVVAARQVVGGVTSASGSGLSYTVGGGPSPSSPAPGSTVTASRFAFTMTAPAGTVLQRETVGVTPVQTIRIPSSGAWKEYLAVPPGSHTLRLRYANPSTGDFGPWSSTSFTAQ
ncbi:sigma-70 family RNA polymerase sigma factor [Microbacterium sp.]|uniref:sigma-70 family RNA polymerase sigma factor n=1 Tax=Microbacterium sp. TaxID=51671 RepID=UPI00356B1125